MYSTTDRSCEMNRYVSPNFCLQISEQVDDLRLDRNVERRDRLVEHHELGVERQGPGDADPLPLAAGELVRIAIEVARIEADLLERFLYLGEPLAAVAVRVNDQPFFDDAADRHSRVERAVGVLEDDLHVAADGPQLRGPQVGDVVAVEHDAAGRRLEQPQDRAAGRGLAAAAFADEAERFAWFD